MVQQQPELASNAAVGRSQDAERGKKTRKFKYPSSSSCFLVFKCPALCDGAEPDRGADSGQEPLQIPETECEAGDQGEHSDHWEPPEAGQLGEGGGEVSGEEPQATQQTPILPRPPAGGGVRPGMLCCQ